MATVNLGRIGFVNKGNWVASTAYKLNDVVTYSNKVYACTIAHTSTTTFDETKWILWVDNSGYALLNGDATQTFKVADGVATNDAVNFSQLSTKANLQGDATKTFKVADAVNTNEALAKGQLLTEIKSIGGAGSGLDADLLDGLDSTAFAHSQNIGNTDLNTITQSGMYRINDNNANTPPGVSYGQLLVVYGGADTITQIISDFTSTNLYWRSGNPINNSSGVWYSWQKIWHTGNDGSGSGLDADKLDGLDSTAFALANGDNTKTFKVSDAINADEAVSKGQLLAHYPTLTYVEYTTGISLMSIAQPAANIWFDLPSVTITIPKDGIYTVTYDVRMWQNVSTSAFWKKHRVLKNGTEITKSVLFGFDKGTLNSACDTAHSKTFVDSFLAGDVLQVQGYWDSYTAGGTNYSNGHGGTSIVAIKIG